MRRLRLPRGEALAWGALTVLLCAGAVLCLRDTRGTTLTFDEWDWVQHRRGDSLSTFLSPHNGHLSLLPLLIYRLLFATAGLQHYVVYRLLVVALHLLCVGLLYVYLRRRVPDLLALAGAASILFLGPAWQNFLWPFQVAWLISISAGLAALLALDRHDRKGDVAASVLLACSLASSGVGAAVAVGVAVDILARPDRWRRVYVVLIPLVFYGLWWLIYQNESLAHNAFGIAPGFAATGVSATIAALLGLAGETIPFGSGSLLTYGRPLAVVAVIGLLWYLWRKRTVSARGLALLATQLSFWISAGVSRGDLTQGYDSRYLYVGGVFTVALVAELARGVRVPRWITAAIVVVAALAIGSNLGDFSESAGFQRSEADVIRADLAAIDLGRPLESPTYVARAFSGAPAIRLEAGPYFAAARAYGTPALSPAALERQPDNLRVVADSELISIHHLRITPSQAGARPGPRPRVELVRGGRVQAQGACLTFVPRTPSGGPGTRVLEIVVPPGGVSVHTTGAGVAVAVRRFASAWQPLGSIASHATADVPITPDLSPVAWHLQFFAGGRTTVCGLRPQPSLR